MRSAEELIDESNAQYDCINLLLLLHSNWEQFLKSTARTIQHFKFDIKKISDEIMIIKSSNEIEKNELEKMYKKECEKFKSKPLVQKLKQFKEKYNQMKISIETEKKDLNNQISLLNINNIFLKGKITQYEKDTNILRTAKTIRQLTDDLQQTKEMLKNETENKSNIGFRLHTILSATETDLKKVNSKMIEKTTEYNQLLDKYKQTLEILANYQERIKEYAENIQMINEDILQTELKTVKLFNLIKEKDILIEERTKNVQELETQLKLQREGLVQKKEVSIEGTLFNFVWDSPISRTNNETRYNSRSDKNHPKEYQLNIVHETKEIRLDTINVKKYSYLRPTYRTLIDNLLPQDGNKIVKYDPSFPIWLHVVIRAIFDSKYTEVLLSCNKGKRITRFPDFVYSWLGTFYIEKNTREIKCLEYTEKDAISRKNRLDILIGLEASNNDKLWEMNVFKEFLEEELGLDELVYFLHCRFILFKGSQMSVPTAGFCVTHFVSKDRVFDAIERIMYAYSEDDKKELMGKLTEFAKHSYKDPNAFDYAMVLRVLLEFYRKEKKENLVKFEKLYNTSKQNLKTSSLIFPFQEFNNILQEDYDKNINDSDICNIYRESYIAGGCSITSDSILLTFSETPFWIQYLRLKGQNSEPKYDGRGDIDQSDEKGKECALVYSYYFV